MPDTEYGTYLRIDELLHLQHPLTPDAHDEMLFVVIHQVYELWFKLVLHEVDSATESLLAGRPQGAIAPLRRVLSIDEVLIAQLRVLETMSPEGFLRFRDPLKPASGLQSGVRLWLARRITHRRPDAHAPRSRGAAPPRPAAHPVRGVLCKPAGTRCGRARWRG